MPIRFASEPRSASIAGCGNTGPLSATEQKGKECHNQDKQAQGASFGGSFLVPEIDMIFGDGVGASLVVVMVVVAVVVVVAVGSSSSSSSSSSCCCC